MVIIHYGVINYLSVVYVDVCVTVWFNICVVKNMFVVHQQMVPIEDYSVVWPTKQHLLLDTGSAIS